jgi:hypothetical protein
MPATCGLNNKPNTAGDLRNKTLLTLLLFWLADSLAFSANPVLQGILLICLN